MKMLLLIFGIIYSIIFVIVVNNFPWLIFPILLFPCVLGVLLSIWREKESVLGKIVATIMLPFALFVVFG